MKRLLLAAVLLGGTLGAQAQMVNYPAENWCIQKATDQNNNLVFITANLSYKDFQQKEAYSWFLWVNIKTGAQNANGHPTADEAPVLNATEDAITAALRQVCVAHFVGRTTVKGHRELLYFLDDPEKANAALTKLAKKRQPRPWEYQMQEDPEWQHVLPFFNGTPKCL